MNKKIFKSLLIICIANSIIYTLPYLQGTYYDSMINAYGFSHTQMGKLMGIYGAVNMPAYIFGGMAADIMDTKKLFVFSLFATGITGLYSATLPSYIAMLVINVFWSFSTILTFWPAMLRAVKILSEEGDRARVYSYKEILFSVLGFILSMAALFVFNKSGENFVKLLVFYSLCHIAIGFAVLFIMPSQPPSGNVDIKEVLGGIVKVIKVKGIWLVGFTIFFAQMLSVGFGRFIPFLTGMTGLSASTAAFIAILATNGLANIGSIAGGKISRAMNSPAGFISYIMILCAVITAGFMFMEWNSETAALCVAVYIILRIINGALRSVVFATMNQINIPPALLGTASGVISIIGYSPDIFAYTLCGSVMEKFPPLTAYRIIFAGFIFCCICGFIVSKALHNLYMKQKKA